jgi:hypothetical protein
VLCKTYIFIHTHTQEQGEEFEEVETKAIVYAGQEYLLDPQSQQVYNHDAGVYVFMLLCMSGV